MMPGVRSITIPGVSLYRGLTLEETITAVVTQGRVLDDRKGELKTKICVLVGYSY